MALEAQTEVASCPKCSTSISSNHAYAWCSKCGEPLPSTILARLPKIQSAHQPTTPPTATSISQVTSGFPPIGSRVCWFCGATDSPVWSDAEAQMYSALKIQFQRRTWQQRVVAIPRCTRCSEAHRRVRETRLWILGIAFLVGVALLYALGGDARDPNTGYTACFTGVLFSLASIPIARWVCRHRILPRDVKDAAYGAGYPAVECARKEGWRLGSPSSSLASIFRKLNGYIR
jgi:hypothetical protein